MNSTTQIQWSQLMMALGLYATVLLYQGYIYGTGDQSQILPCLYALDHPGFYAGDHYVTSYLAGGVNERTIFHFLFRYLGYNSSWMMWIWHVVFSIALIMAWLRITAMGIKHKLFQYLAMATVLVIGFHTSVGGNEIYYNSVVPSLVAKALASWALYFWLEGKYKYWIIGLVLSCFIQPLVGLQLFLLTTGALLLARLIEKAPRIVPWKWILGFVVVVLPWFYLLVKNNGGHEQPELFMEIMEFRLAHHFMPGSFGFFHWVMFLILVVIALNFYKHRMRWFMLLLITGCLVYVIGVGVMNNPLILYSQWFKTTIWLEALAFIAFCAWLEKNIKNIDRLLKYWVVLPVLLLLAVGTYRLSGWFGPLPEYMLPWVQSQNTEIQIAEQARLNTPEDAVFIVPVDFMAFRWYAKRSLYVDYKALFHSEYFLTSWYGRIQDIYAYSVIEKRAGFDLSAFSHELLSDPSQISIDYWRGLGITHIVSPNGELGGLRKVAESAGYAVYQLR